jgi:glucoamylase
MEDGIADARSIKRIESTMNFKSPMKTFPKISVSICVYLWLIFLCFSATAQTLAPGAPGKDAQWATAGKQGVGTSATLESKVWFTLAQGVMTEIYYPDVTVANVHLLQFVVVNPKTKKVETEQDDAVHEVKVLKPDSLTFQQINTAKSGEWKITKTYTTDVERDSVLINVKFESKNGSNLFIYYDPSIKNSGMHDTAWTQGSALLAQDENIVSALAANPSFNRNIDNKVVAEGLSTNGFYGINDGLTQLKKKLGDINLESYDKAENGNVVQVSTITSTKHKTSFEKGRTVMNIISEPIEPFTIALSFGKTPNEALKKANVSLEKGFQKCLEEYEKGWSDYVKTLRKVEPKYQAQFNMAAMILKAHEDKKKRGANIASLSVPWGGGDNANENNIGGYHLVWSRDLYQVATAFMALGDKDAAVRALEFLFNVQQKPDGSFPQNSYLDGKPFWGSLQMDEVAFPLILAYQLERNDKKTWENHVKRAADFIVKNGPTTPQERWEERSGYSPSTIAAEIAGLVCAAEIAKKNGDVESANLYLKTADEWQANIEKWTVTTNGKYGDGNYYLRITQKGNPNAGDKIDLGNGAGMFDEREIVDAGFLELVRLGIKSPDDPLIAKSVKVIDEVIRVQTPNGDAFYRYNNDGYGEMDDGRRWNFDGKYTGKGRLWALLSGERGQYELAQSFHFKSMKPEEDSALEMAQYTRLSQAKSRLEAMSKFANGGLMIPEQIWDKAETPKNADKQFVPELKFGEGTGSATPLAWSMAQFIRLAVNLQAGRNLDTPDVVYNRYVLGKKSEDSSQKSVEKTVATDCPNVDSYHYESKNMLMTIPQRTAKYPSILGAKGETESAMRFAYFGLEKNIEIAGDFTGWKPCALKFIKLNAIPNINYLVLKFPNSARIEYKLIVDGRWITDPLNPNKVDNGVGGENSFFTMPDYVPTSWDKEIEKSPLFDQKVSELEIDSKKFGKRTVKIYVPSEYYKRGIAPKLPVLYLQDGSEYIARAKAINVLENLVTANKVEPFMIVFIDPKVRMKEYWANDDYADYIAKEVVPAVEKKYFSTIKTGRENRALLGASLGGITSFHTAIKYPEIFGCIGGQSSSFWVDNERVVKELENLDASKNKFTFYIDDGILEGVEDSRKVVKLLKDKGFDVTYVEAEAGHNWTAWRDRLADVFIALWK